MIVALAIGLRWALVPAFGEVAQLILYYFTVVTCAWYGGLRQGLLGAALSALIALYIFFPTYSFANKGPHVLPRLINYILTGALISLLAEILRWARKKPQENESSTQNRREELRVTLSSIGNAVMATQTESRFSFMNPLAEFLIRWKRKEALGKLLEEAFHIVEDQMRGRIGDPTTKVKENGLAVRMANHNVLISGDITERPIDSGDASIRGKMRRLVGFLSIFRDVIHRNKERRGLLDINRRLQASEERLQLILQTSRVVVWDWRPQANQVTTTENIAELYGVSEIEYAELGFGLLHPEDRDRRRAAVQNVVDKGDGYHSEFRIIRPDTQSIVWIEERAFAITDDEGRVIRLIGVAADITDRKSRDEEIRRLNSEIQERLDDMNTLLEILPVGVCIGNQDCSQINGNSAAQLIMGLTPEVNGSGATAELEVPPGSRIFVDGEEMVPENSPMRQVALTGKPLRNFEHELLFPDGTRKSVYASVAPLFDRKGAVRKVIGAYTDFTERKQFEREREESLLREQAVREEAQVANRLKDEFLATVSHELRAPLHSIIGWVSLLKAGKLSHDDAARALDTVGRNAHAQSRLIGDLLEVSSIIKGKTSLDFRPVELASVIEAAVDSLRQTAEAKGVRLQTVLYPIPGPVSGDEERLQQVIWNLLSNAVKFTPNGGRVQVLLRHINSQVEIVVSDTGQGISAEFLPHVFERFKQASTGLTRKYGGLGLGLAIVRHLVEIHGGAVEAESPGEGQGTTFRVRLPLSIIREAIPVVEKPAGRCRFENQPILDGVSVLVLDDDPQVRELMSALLRGCAATVHTADSAASAREILNTDRVDVILSDIEMPGEDGYAFIRSVRLEEKTYKIPAVALSGYAQAEDRTMALRSGFLWHLTKPVEPAELIAIVANLTGRACPSSMVNS
ncbi:MAG: response regulator [Chloracidobacterium sp.]|nr:response regulator [Chloracidobacterium sp.]